MCICDQPSNTGVQQSLGRLVKAAVGWGPHAMNMQPSLKHGWLGRHASSITKTTSNVM